MYLLDNDDKESTKPVKKRDHRAERNPHYQHSMSQESRNAIASSQRARFFYYKNAVANMMTEERVREIIKETIDSYMSQNLLKKNNKPNNIPL